MTTISEQYSAIQESKLLKMRDISRSWIRIDDIKQCHIQNKKLSTTEFRNPEILRLTPLNFSSSVLRM